MIGKGEGLLVGELPLFDQQIGVQMGRRPVPASTANHFELVGPIGYAPDDGGDLLAAFGLEGVDQVATHICVEQIVTSVVMGPQTAELRRDSAVHRIKALAGGDHLHGLLPALEEFQVRRDCRHRRLCFDLLG